MRYLTALLTFIFGCVISSAAITPEKIDLPSGGILYYYQADNSNNGLTVMMCPGGAYEFVALDHEGHDMAEWFHGQNINYAVLHYRLPKEACDTLPMIDTHEALAYLHKNAAKLGINTDKLGIMGASAGGHLASYTANKDALVKFQILLYPVISMYDKVTHIGSRVNLIGDPASNELRDKFSSEKLVNKNTPQAFIVLSSDDDVVPPMNSLLYYSALINNKVAAEMHIFPTGAHGWGFKDNFTHKSEWLTVMAKWLNNVAK